MKFELVATKRHEQGTSASRRLRHAGKVPAILYGNDQEPLALEVDHKALMLQARRPGFTSTVVFLDVEGDLVEVLVRSVQRHPFKPLLMHVDFQRLCPTTKIKMRVPLKYLNAELSPAVKMHSAIVSYLITFIEIECLPKDLPSSIEVNLGTLEVGQSLHLSDLNLPEGVQCISLNKGDNLSLVTVAAKGVVVAGDDAATS